MAFALSNSLVADRSVAAAVDGVSIAVRAAARVEAPAAAGATAAVAGAGPRFAARAGANQALMFAVAIATGRRSASLPMAAGFAVTPAGAGPGQRSAVMPAGT